MVNNYRIYRHCLIWAGLPDKEYKLSTMEVNDMLKHSSAWMLRNCYSWDCGKKTNFWYIIKESYNPESYNKKTKKYIKKANERFHFGIISPDVFKEQGYRVYSQAFNRYRVCDGFKQNETDFFNRINQLSSNHDIWGAIDKETNLLEAYAICKRNDYIVEFESSKANPDFLSKYYVMYGLYDSRNQYYLGLKRFKIAISSARSISQHSNIQDFLIDKFNFRKAYCQMNIYYKPWLRGIISIIYPFRKFIKHPKLYNLLKFEEINRENS